MSIFILHTLQVSRDGTQLRGVFDLILNSRFAEDSYSLFQMVEEKNTGDLDIMLRQWWNSLPDEIKADANGVCLIPEASKGIIDINEIMNTDDVFIKVIPDFQPDGKPNFDSYYISVDATQNSGEVLNFTLRGEPVSFALDRLSSAINTSMKISGKAEASLVLKLWWISLNEDVRNKIVVTKEGQKQILTSYETSDEIDASGFIAIKYRHDFINEN